VPIVGVGSSSTIVMVASPSAMPAFDGDVSAMSSVSVLSVTVSFAIGTAIVADVSPALNVSVTPLVV
jgi:hypothetical protein